MKATSYKYIDELVRAVDALNTIDCGKYAVLEVRGSAVAVQIGSKDWDHPDYTRMEAILDGWYDKYGNPGNEDEGLPKLLEWVRSYYMPQNAKPKEKTPEQTIRELREDVDRILDHLGMRA